MTKMLMMPLAGLFALAAVTPAFGGEPLPSLVRIKYESTIKVPAIPYLETMPWLQSREPTQASCALPEGRPAAERIRNTFEALKQAQRGA